MISKNQIRRKVGKCDKVKVISQQNKRKLDLAKVKQVWDNKIKRKRTSEIKAKFDSKLLNRKTKT